MMTMLVILRDACAMFFLTSKYYTLPEFRQMVQTKSEEECLHVTLQGHFKYDSNQDELIHECYISLPEKF